MGIRSLHATILKVKSEEDSDYLIRPEGEVEESNCYLNGDQISKE